MLRVETTSKAEVLATHASVVQKTSRIKIEFKQDADLKYSMNEKFQCITIGKLYFTKSQDQERHCDYEKRELAYIHDNLINACYDIMIHL